LVSQDIFAKTLEFGRASQELNVKRHVNSNISGEVNKLGGCVLAAGKHRVQFLPVV